MVNYLYTITAHSEYGAWQSSVEGVSIVNTYDAQTNLMVQSPLMVIDTPGQGNDGLNVGALGHTQNPSGTDRAIFTRVSDGGTNPYNGENPPYFSILIGDTENNTSNPVSGWDGLIGANDEERDWVGNSPDLTWHTPYMGLEVYTLIVPTDNVIYQSATQRLGNVLVWHIPASLLGIYSQNANLPFRPTELPLAADSDIKAASKIWGMGFGLIFGAESPGDNIPFIDPATL